MKKAILLTITIISIFVGCNNDNSNNVMRWKENDTSDMNFYIGSASGGISIPYDTVTKLNIDRDSLRTVIASNTFTSYNSSLYSLMTITFDENRVTYRDSADLSYSKTIISEYIFENDTLYAIKSDNKLKFIALGNNNKLYRTKGFARFKNIAGRDTIISSDKPFDLETTIEAAGISSFTNATDTVKWFNVKYIFTE